MCTSRAEKVLASLAVLSVVNLLKMHGSVCLLKNSKLSDFFTFVQFDFVSSPTTYLHDVLTMTCRTVIFLIGIK